MTQETPVRKALLLILAFLLLGVAAPGFAQRCDNVKIRLWVGKDSSDSVWHRRGETVSIPAGAWARIAVYVEGAGKVPSTTQAQVGFVGGVGLAGGPGPGRSARSSISRPRAPTIARMAGSS